MTAPPPGRAPYGQPAAPVPARGWSVEGVVSVAVVDVVDDLEFEIDRGPHPRRRR
ncbi:hypothetical protein [Streptomyces sp. NPDC060022]|uniref:hypothetical protein n=1 Tax=Streptomyces sp. NPDC060022 TaxID=3347039 RepID=UPI00368C93A9